MSPFKTKIGPFKAQLARVRQVERVGFLYRLGMVLACFTQRSKSDGFLMMRLSNYGFVIGLGLSLVTLGTSCQAPVGNNGAPVLSFARSAVEIESLRRPERVERSLPLSGSVVQRLAVLDGWLYQLDDGTGQLWVVTQKAAPAVGEHVYVKGVLRYEAIVINGADLGDYYLEENQRELQTPDS